MIGKVVEIRSYCAVNGDVRVVLELTVQPLMSNKQLGKDLLPGRVVEIQEVGS